MESEQVINRISAADNLIIEVAPPAWRLISTSETGVQRKVLEVLPGRSLRYTADFAATRRLPNTGKLPPGYIWQVVLGWSHDDEAWHLGLLLARDLADARGSRWCELAYWPDPEKTVFAEIAHKAGQSLAQTLQRPFNYIPPRQRTTAPEPPLPELPLNIGLWKLEKTADGSVQFLRSRRWMTSRLLRMGWYALLIVVYLVLSVTTLNSTLALPNAGTMLPNPELLPYLGLVVVAGLALMILYVLYELLTQPNKILVDAINHRIMGLRGSSVRWNKDLSEFEALYVTQVVNKRGSKRTVYHGEINLHLGKNQFYQVMAQSQHDEEVAVAQAEDGPAQETVQLLTPAKVASDLQAAALYIGKALGGLPVWYDQRTR